MIGSLIAGRFRLLAELGDGGMGTVYKAEDVQAGVSVAVKRLKLRSNDREPLARFKREAEALRQLDHPNIVKMHHAFEDAGEHYLVMDYVAGGDLDTRLETDGAIDFRASLHMMMDLVDALTRAHRLGIVHRDIKPANVLIAADGTLRLSDFGIARVSRATRITDTDSIVGTMNYLPPEAFLEGAYDERGDIWGLGVLLYYMVSGVHPFPAESLAQTISQITTQPIPDLEAQVPNLPVALIDLIYRMLERDPQARIPSVRIIGAEIETILDGRPPVIASGDSTDTTRSDVAQRHNLPAQTTPFVGRDLELAELNYLLDQPATRMVTILAPGGMGKTRLSLALAEQRLDAYAHGVFFVDLSPLNDPERIADAITEAIDLASPQSDQTPLEHLAGYLSKRHMLLVLDNYEHLIDGAGLVTTLLKAAADLQVVVTSRQRLNQSSETVFPLSGFDMAEWASLETALESAAARLFLQGARRARPSFELADDNLRTVFAICKQVDGMPLGILLAASWLGMLSPQEIHAEIERGVEFLETTLDDVPQRQRSLRAVFDYSWELLSEAERGTFMALSIFKGGFTREAAQHVTGASLLTLMTLVNKSLLRRDAESGRYTIHELVRQFAAAQLDASGQKEAVERLHSEHYALWLASVDVDIKYERSLSILDQIDRDLENIRAGLFFAIDHMTEDVDAYLEPLMQYFNRRTLWVAGEATFAEALRRYQDTESLTYRRILLRLGSLVSGGSYSWRGAQTDRDDRMARIQAIDLDDLPLYEQCRYYFALLDETLQASDTDLFVTYGHHALAIAEEVGDAYLQLQALFFLNRSRLSIEGREHYYDLSLKSQDYMFLTSRSLGSGSVYATDMQTSKQHLLDGLKYARAIRNAWGIIVALENLAMVAYYYGEFDAVNDHLQTMASMIDDYQMTSLQPHYGYVSVVLLLGTGQFEAAAAELEALPLEFGEWYLPHWLAYHQESAMPDLQTLKRETATYREWVENNPGSLPKFMLIHLLLAIAMHDVQNRHYDEALRLTASSLAHSSAPDWYADGHPVVRKLLAELRDALPSEMFEAIWAEGAARDIMAIRLD